MAQTYYDMVQSQKGNPPGLTQPDTRSNVSELDTRMQADADLLHLSKYTMKDAGGKTVPGIINLTLNRPAVFAANVISSLAASREQIIVESQNRRIDTYKVETFLNAALSAANRRLWKRGLPQLNEFADVQFCIRGRTARRVLMRRENGAVTPDIMPWDGRYVYSEHGSDGLAWAAYETMRTVDIVKAEYGDVAAAKAVNSECAVLDAWDEERNEVWIDGQLVKEQRHSYGFCPVVQQIVMLGYGSTLLDRGWAKYDGESIFFMIRDIVPELNRLASLLQTLNMNEIKAALQYQNPDGSPQDEPPDRPEMSDVVSVGKGDLRPINLGEAKQAAAMLYNIMEKAFQEGSYTDIDIGNVQQPFSAVALVTIGENKDVVYMPRLAAKEMLNKATAEMLIAQTLQMGVEKIELGTPGHKKTFQTAELEGDYEINYRYFVKSPKTDIARMSVAQIAERYYPRPYILEHVLQVEDAKTIERQWSRQKAGEISLNVERHRVIMALLDEAEQGDDAAALEAEILALELGVSIDQLKMGNFPEELQKQQKTPYQQSPLMGDGGQNNNGLPLFGASGQVGGLNPMEVSAMAKTRTKEK